LGLFSGWAGGSYGKIGVDLMKALYVADGGSLALREVEPPADAGECRIRVSMAGICGTDLQLLGGYAGFQGIAGHEFTGIVEAAPAADASWVGKRVVGEINVGCGTCAWCASGVREHCVNRTVVGIRGREGAFAEFISLPAANLHELPAAIDDETAVFVEPTAAACRILEQVAIDERSRIAVVGDGRLGLLVAQVLRTRTPSVRVLGRHEHKLAIARALGLECGHAEGVVLVDHRFDVVVDATGRPAGLRRALEIVKPRGIVVLKSTFHGEAPLASWPIVVDEVTLVGSRCGPFRAGIEMLASGAVQVKPLVSRIAALEEYESAFADARRSLKVLFACNF
jgi:alcohol dehydrogenase